MKTKSAIISLVLILICFISIVHSDDEPFYNLNGEWNAVITIIYYSGYTSTTKDIIKISQHGNQFGGVGIKVIGGKSVEKGEEIIKGKLLNRMVEDIFMRYVHDQTTFDLSWADARATITEKGNKIVIQSFIQAIKKRIFVTITLARK